MPKRLKIGEEGSTGVSVSLILSKVERLEKLYAEKVEDNPNLNDKFCKKDRYGEFNISISKVLQHLIQEELNKHEAY